MDPSVNRVISGVNLYYGNEEPTNDKGRVYAITWKFADGTSSCTPKEAPKTTKLTSIDFKGFTLLGFMSDFRDNTKVRALQLRG
jgi:hypothetical protein